MIATWDGLKETLRRIVMNYLDMAANQIAFDTEPLGVTDFSMQFSLVSAVDEFDPWEVIDAETGQSDWYSQQRIQLQVNLLGGNDAEVMNFAHAMRIHFFKRHIRALMGEAGFKMVERAGPLRDTSYEDRNPGYFQAEKSFELPLRAIMSQHNSKTTGFITQVVINGVGGVLSEVEIDVSDPS